MTQTALVAGNEFTMTKLYENSACCTRLMLLCFFLNFKQLKLEESTLIPFGLRQRKFPLVRWCWFYGFPAFENLWYCEWKRAFTNTTKKLKEVRMLYKQNFTCRVILNDSSKQDSIQEGLLHAVQHFCFFIWNNFPAEHFCS